HLDPRERDRWRERRSAHGPFPSGCERAWLARYAARQSAAAARASRKSGSCAERSRWAAPRFSSAATPYSSSEAERGGGWQIEHTHARPAWCHQALCPQLGHGTVGGSAAKGLTRKASAEQRGAEPSRPSLCVLRPVKSRLSS